MQRNTALASNWTDNMIPSQPDQATLRAFAAAAALSSAATAGIIAALVTAPLPGVIAGSVAGAVVVVAAWLRPGAVRSAYRYWSRLQRAYARWAIRLFIGMIHYGIMTPVARLGGRSGFWQSAADAGWISHRPEEVGVEDRGTWWRGVWARNRGPGRAWILALAPFLAALRMLSQLNARKDAEVPTTMYTLY
jgi:hypothetical protein